MAMTAEYILGGRRRLLLVGGAVVLLIVLAVGLGAGLRSSAEDDDGGATLTMPKPPTTPVSFREFEASINEGPGGRGWSSVGLSDSRLGEYGTAAVSSDGFPCAALAKGILLKNGTAADAAIAGLFCTGVVNTQSLGLGGGFLATYYDRATRTAYTLDAREVAPIAATRDMYKGNATKSFKGALSVAVPGEVHGYYALYRKFGGGLPWRDLLAPAIRLCEDGHPVNWHMAKALRKLNESTQAEPTMSVFLNPVTGQVYKEGEILRRPALAATLRAIQDDPLTLYTGELNKKLLQDLKELGSIIQEEDFKNYAARWRTPVNFSLSNGDYTLYSVPPPGSGILLGYILNIMDNYKLSPSSVTGGNGPVTYQRIIEAFKFAYARRTQLGDEDDEDMTQLLSELTSEEVAAATNVLIDEQLSKGSTSQDPVWYGAMTAPPPDDHGTSHFSLLASNGDAVSITSSINQYFGSGVRSRQTGIVLNDQMDDFSTTDIADDLGHLTFTANYIKPGKRPLSSMSPSVIVDRAGDVRLVMGAAGATKIISGLANVVLHNLWFGKDLKQAMDARRLHHQLFPMKVMYEKGFNQTLLDRLSKFGHKLEQFDVGGSVVCAVSAERGTIFANADFRKSGQIDGI